MKFRVMLNARYEFRCRRAILINRAMRKLTLTFAKVVNDGKIVFTYAQISFRSLGGHEYGYHYLPSQIHDHAKLNNLTYTDYGRVVNHHHEHHVNSSALFGYYLT